jgi:hypothetical protein
VILAAVLVTFSRLGLIGCTTDGELSSEHGFSEDSAVLCLLAGDDVRIASGVARQVSAGPEVTIRESVEEAARRLGDAPRLCLTTPTSMTVSDSAIVPALRSALGSGTPVFCATAAAQRLVELNGIADPVSMFVGLPLLGSQRHYATRREYDLAADDEVHDLADDLAIVESEDLRVALRRTRKPRAQCRATSGSRTARESDCTPSRQ